MRKGIVLVVLSLLWFDALAGPESLVMRRYFVSTYQSLECMRGKDGLLMDKVFVTNENKPCPVVPAPYVDTSPSNIGFDLLVQAEALRDSILYRRALNNINTTLMTLSKMSYHVDSGLFFNRYRVDGTLIPTDLFVSSVDNVHLYLALWTLSQPPYSFEVARDLLQRMNLSVFHEPNTDLAYGGIEYRHGQWKLVGWGYRYLGTEARTIYALGRALQIFPTARTSDNVVAELFVHPNLGELFGLWDGGTFQLLLPELLLKESQFSKKFNQWFHNYINFVEAEKTRRGLAVLPAHSACQIRAIPDDYNGHVGSLSLVSTFNLEALIPSIRDIWEQVVSPHALFLMATVDPQRLFPEIRGMESLTDGHKTLYHQELGWLDGLHVNGSANGHIVPALLALDQTIIALSLIQLMSSDGLLSSARLLQQDPARVERLNEYYGEIEHLMSRRPQ
jgi:hypothetical protein